MGRKRKRWPSLASILGIPVTKPRAKSGLVGSLKSRSPSVRKRTITFRAPCTCRGENKNCYKCFGTGFYEKEVLKDLAWRHQSSYSLPFQIPQRKVCTWQTKPSKLTP